MQPSQIPVLYESADLLVAEPEFLELPECDQTAVLPKRASHPTIALHAREAFAPLRGRNGSLTAAGLTVDPTAPIAASPAG